MEQPKRSSNLDKLIRIKRPAHKFRKQHLKYFRESEPIISVLTWGVNQSIIELQEVQMPSLFMNKDYKAHWKIKKVNFNFNKQGQPSQFRFKEYCPLVFKRLRQIFGYDDEKFLKTMNNFGGRQTQNNNNNNSIQTENVNEIKNHEHLVLSETVSMSTQQTAKRKISSVNHEPLTGAFSLNDQETANTASVNNNNNNSQTAKPNKIYYTNDYTIAIKFISSDDVAEMHNFLPKYYRHIIENEAQTLLTKYLAMYRLSHTSSSNSSSLEASSEKKRDKDGGKDYYCVVMENIFGPSEQQQTNDSNAMTNFIARIHKQYDIKGCLSGRSASNKEKERGVLFDKDFIANQEKIILDQKNRATFLEILSKDVNFLADSKIISYSLLIGIHDNLENPQFLKSQEDRRKQQSHTTQHDKGYDSPTKEATDNMDNLDNDVEMTYLSITENNNYPKKAVSYYKNFSADKKTIYSMGLIDCMTEYGTDKKVAHAVKASTKNKERSKEISTVRPQKYRDRFMDFVVKKVIVENQFEV